MISLLISAIEKNKILYLVTLIFVVFAAPVNAKVKHKEYRDWAVFSDIKNNTKICYIVGEPTKMSDQNNNKRQAYITVTNFGDSKEEVSSTSGYIYKKDSVKFLFERMNIYIND